MTRTIPSIGLALFLLAAASADAQNPPTRTAPPPTRNPQRDPAAAAAAPRPPATHDPRWVGCYDVAIADTTGALRAYGTFDLDSVSPARGMSGHNLATVIGGSRIMRAGWQDAPGDSLLMRAVYIDNGFALTMGMSGADSLRGYVKGTGPAVGDSTTRTPAAARRRASCANRVPVAAIHAGMTTQTSDYTLLTTRPPLTVPSWIESDSMVVKQPKASSFVRNTLLIRFRGGSETERHALVQSLGGIVVGSKLVSREARDNMMDFILVVYVEDGATHDDLVRVASRAQGSRIVREIGLYYKKH